VDVRIREATLEDTEPIRALLDEQNRLHTELHPSFFQRSPTHTSRIVELLENPQATFLVAESTHGSICEIIGLTELHLARTKDLPVLVSKRYVHIGEIIVHAKHRGRGIGQMLMEASRSWASSRGAESLRTSVVPANDGARNFYSRQGFRDIMISIESDIETKPPHAS